MTQKFINISSMPNDGKGDKLRVAFNKVNNNFAELYGITSRIGNLSNVAITGEFSDLYGTLLESQSPAHVGDVFNTVGSFYLTIANNAVTNSKMSTVPGLTIKGNPEVYQTNPSDLNGSQIRDIILRQDFDTRTTFVSWLSQHSVPIGHVMRAGGYSYRYIGSGTVISDMLGWVPEGIPYADHFAHNVTPGTTRMGAAINACLTAYGICYLAGDPYAVEVPIEWANGNLIGNGALGVGVTQLIGLSEYIGVTQSLLNPGRSSCIIGLQAGYNTVTGIEARGERIVLNTRGVNMTLGRGAIIDRVLLKNGGTLISDSGHGGFNITFGTIELLDWTYACTDWSAPGRTGNAWINIYAKSQYNPKYGFYCTGRESDCFYGQINIEHTSFSEYPMYMSGTNASFNHVHLEGIDCAVQNKAYMFFEQCDVSFRGLTFSNTRMSQDYTSLIELGQAGYENIDSGYSTKVVTSHLTIDKLKLNGIAAPNMNMYPTYPDSQRGLANIIGLKFIKRTTGILNNDYQVEVGHIQRLDRVVDVGNDLIEKYWNDRYSDKNYIDFHRADTTGRLESPRSNLLLNPSFDTWANTAVTVSSSALIESASQWFVSSASGTMLASRQLDDFGKDNSYYMHVSNLTADGGAIGTFQTLQQSINGSYKRLFDTGLCLSAEMKGNISGRIFEQISLVIKTDSSTQSFQLIPGSDTELQLTTNWLPYRLRFDPVLSSSITVTGTNPVAILKLQLNAGTATRQAAFDLRNIKLEQGLYETRFTKQN